VINDHGQISEKATFAFHSHQIVSFHDEAKLPWLLQEALFVGHVPQLLPNCLLPFLAVGGSVQPFFSIGGV
jgi:hypothetical protein